MGFLIMLVSLDALLQIRNSIYQQFFFSQVNSWCLLSHFWTLTCAPAPVYLCFSPIPVFYRCESQTGTMWAKFTVVVHRKSCEASQNPKDMPGMENKQQMLQCHRTKVERHNPSIPVRCISSASCFHALCWLAGVFWAVQLCFRVLGPSSQNEIP